MSVLDPVEGIKENLAIKYLDIIFGNMSDTLPFSGAGSYPILGPVFEVFNMIALTAGIMLVIYHVVVGTIRTANDGKLMGERESPVIRIIQMLSSIVLLIPTASGYCLAQILFMHIVVFGVYAADNVWKKALDIFVDPPTAVNVSLSMDDLNNSDQNEIIFDKEYRIQFRNNLQGIMEAIMCSRGVWKTEEENVINKVVDGSSSGKTIRFEFGRPTSSSHDSTPPCGYLDVASYTSAQVSALEKWMNEFMLSGNGDNGRCIRDGYDCSPSTGDFFIDIIKDSDKHIGYYPNHSAWLDDLITQFTGNTKSQLPKVNSSECSDERDCLIEMMGQSGWILAGNYYRVIYELIATLYDENFVKPVRIEEYKYYAEEADHVARATLYWQYFNIGDDAYWCQRWYNGETSACDESSVMFGSYSRLRNATDQLSGETKRLGIKTALDISVIDFINVISLGTTGIYKIEDPFTKLVQYGYKLMHKGRNIITGLTWANVSLTGVSALARFGGPVSASIGTVIQSMQSALTAVVPFAYAIAGIFYTLGGVLSIYLPMIPFIIFLVAAIGWLISVIESMVAAPLVAIGVIWPDAQPHVLGRAETAVMMLLNLFLRPTFIIIGFLAAIAMAYVGVSLLNIGFLNMLEYGGLMVEDLLGPLILQSFYVGLVYVIIKNCFTLITAVPDKVLMWIGDRSQGQPGAEEALGGAKNQGDSGMSGGMRAVDSTANAPAGVTQGTGDAIGKSKAIWKKQSNKPKGSGMESEG